MRTKLPLITLLFLFLTNPCFSQSWIIGALNPGIGSSASFTATIQFMQFDVLHPAGVVIDSVDLYPTSGPGQLLTIVIQNSAGVNMATWSGVTTVASGMPQREKLDLFIPPGTGYRWGMSVNPGMTRNSTGANYPYTVPGLMSITGNTFSATYYYYFYNIRIRLPFNPIPNDAGISAITSPLSPASTGLNPVKVSLNNYGTQNLNSANIHWAVNGVSQTPLAWTGSLTPGSVDTGVMIGSYNFASGSHQLRAWTSLPNGVPDTAQFNDSASMHILVCDPLIGTYTIGNASAHFLTIQSAILATATCGVSGPVIFNVLPGVYQEQLEIPLFPGANATNTVTFQSSTGLPADVVITNTATSAADNWVLRLNGARYVNVQNMTIKTGITGTFGRTIELIYGASHNLIAGNIIESIPGSTSTNTACIYSGNSLDEFNVITGNTLRYGYYSIYLIGASSTSLENGNILTDNIIEHHHYYGIFVQNQSNILINNNRISNGLMSGNVYAIRTSHCYDGSRVTKNRVNMTGSNTNYGIFMNNTVGSVLDPALFANNMVSQTSTTSGTLYMSYFLNSSHVKFYHNSLHSVSSATNYGLYFFTGNSNIELVNNMVVATGGGYAIYGTTANLQSISQSNFNNFITTGASVAYAGTPLASIQAWYAATGLDSNSVSIDPVFLSNTALYPTNIAMNNLGTPVALVMDDIDGNPRSASHPDIGAVEFDPPQHDAGVISIHSPVSPAYPGLQSISVSIRNYGLVDLLSVTVNWCINNGPVTSHSWLGYLPPNQNFGPIVAGSFLFPLGQHEVKVWTTGPNGQVDGNATNDTAVALINICSLMQGLYTIGGGTADYPSIPAALAALDSCGVGGPIVFNVLPGTYAGQITIPNIPGSSDSNTVTFQGSTGNPADIIITYVPTAAADNWVLRLDGARHVTCKNMTLKTGLTGTFGRVVELTNGASFNRIENNIIESVLDTAYLNANGIYSGPSLDEHNIISNNIIRYGAYGIYLSGPSTSVFEEGNIIEGNIIIDYRYSGIWIQRQSQIAIKGNTLTNLATGGGIYPLRLDYCGDAPLILSNRLTLQGGIGGHTGMYVLNTSGDATIRGLIANNIIHQTASMSGTSHLLSMVNSSYLDFYHNTFCSHTTASSNGLSFLTGNSHISLINNMVINMGDGVVLNGSVVNMQAITQSNYNNFYTTGSALALVGTPLADLAAWQLLYGHDTNSVSLDPGFLSMNDVIPSSSQLNNLGIPLAVVTHDILGQPRDTLHPDLGAIEFEPLAHEAAHLGFLSPATGCNLGLEAVSILIVNKGTMAITGGLTAAYQVIGSTSLHVDTITAYILPNDTIMFTFSALVDLTALADTSFQLVSWINLLNDSVAANDTAWVSILSKVAPPPPVVFSQAITAGQQATLNIINPDSNQVYFWYDQDTAFIPLASGTTYTTPPLWSNSIYYVDAMYGDGFATVSLGPGMAAAGVLPTYGYFDYSWSYSIYLAAELPTAGNIHHLSYYVDNFIYFEQLGQRIYMLHTSDTSVAPAYPGTMGMSQVFLGDISWEGPGWYRITLDTPFYFNGTDNLVIYWENHDGDYNTPYPAFRYTPTTSYLAAYQYADNNFPAVSGILTYNRPDIRLEGSSNACVSDRVADTVFVMSPVLLVNAGNDTSFCEGDTLLISAMVTGGFQPYTYVWSPATGLSDTTAPSPLAFPLLTTTYTVTVTDQNGDSGTDDIIVTVTAAPGVTFTPVPGIYDNTPAFPLTTGSPAGGNYSGPGVSGGIFDPAAAGAGTHTLTYTYTDPVTGCTGSATAQQVVTIYIGLDEHRNGPGISIYPNPSSGMLVLTLRTNDTDMLLELLDVQGRLVMEKRLIHATGRYELDLRHLPRGTYHLKISGMEETLSSKLILH